jgi:hypothetical protein
LANVLIPCPGPVKIVERDILSGNKVNGMASLQKRDTFFVTPDATMTRYKYYFQKNLLPGRKGRVLPLPQRLKVKDC